jgi:hypothetical protein
MPGRLGRVSRDHLKGHQRAFEAQTLAQLATGQHQGSARSFQPGLSHTTTRTPTGDIHPVHAAGFWEALAQARRSKAFLPSMDRTVLVMVRDAHEVRKLLAPDHPAGFRDATRTAVEHRIDQFAAMDQHQRTRLGHRLTGAGGFSFNTLVHLTRHGGLHIPATTAIALTKGIRSSGDGLGFQRGQGPMVGHLTPHNAGEIRLNSKRIHNP